MRLITESELTSRTDVDLAVLFHQVSQALADTAPGSHARRLVIENLQTISREQADRHRRSTVPGF